MSIRSILAPPRWALTFHRRHLALVTGICAIPAVERFTGQLWERPAPLGLMLEVATLAARLLLVVLIVRLMTTADPKIADLSLPEVGRHVVRYVRRHSGHLVGQVALLVAAVVIADIVPEQVVPALTETGPLYWAVLLGVKNLTVIPFTMIWLIAWLRHALLAAEADRDGEPSGAVSRS